MFDWIKTRTSKNRKDFGKYNFYVKHQPQIIDSSTTLTLTTYTNTSETATIPCRYKWSIIKNGLTIEVPQFKGSSFRCQPSDVGAMIQAEVISTDPQYSGTAIIQFGPVKLDVSLKKQIEMAISTGCTTMPVYLLNNGEQKECQIRLFEDVIKINHAYSDNNYTFDYSIFEPRMECVSKDSSKLIIIFSERYESELRRFTKKLFEEPVKDLTNSLKSNISTNTNGSLFNRLDIKFMNRNSRDIFLFAMKAFNTKKQLRSSIILNKIQKIDVNTENFDYILQIESLKGQLVKMDLVVKRAHQQKLKYMQQIHKLEKQIEEIILTYTRIVQQKFQNQAELSKDYSILTSKRDQIISRKYKNLENENNHLNSRIQTLTKEIDNIRFKPQSQPMQMMSPPIVGNGNNFNTVGQEKIVVHYNSSNNNQNMNYDYQYNNAFTKKKGYELDNSGIANILDELGQSRISYISSIKQDPELKMKLQHAMNQKQQLQKKLEKSFHKIDQLQKQKYQMQQQLSDSKIQKMNNSAIHFTYNPTPGYEPILNYNQSQHNLSAVFDRQKDNLLVENNELKKSNESLLMEKKKLIQELKNSKIVSPQNVKITQRNSGEQDGGDNSLNFLKTQKKDSTYSEKEKDLMDSLNKKDLQIKLLKMQNQELKKANQKLKKALQSSKTPSQQQSKLYKKITQLQQQIQMYRKNADALNRSQQLSMQMDNYNQQQIHMLKQHNQFLTNQNEKLAKACEKYMTQAKQTNKLRLEIIRLKERNNQLQLMNNNNSQVMA